MRREILSGIGMTTPVLILFFATQSLAQCGDPPPPPDIDVRCIAWGKPARGLQFGICPSESLVRQGDVVTFHLAFRLDPAAMPDEAVHHFARAADGYTTVAFVDAAGRTFTRREEQVHGPALVPFGSDHAPLQPGVPVWGACRVGLLDPDGEQLPAGRYRVRAVFDNRLRPMHQDEIAVGVRFWSGALESAEREMVVRSAQPEEVTLRLRSQLRMCATEQGTGYVWTDEDPVVLRILRRPGYQIFEFSSILARVDGIPQPVGGRLGPLVWRDDESCHTSPLLGPDTPLWAEIKVVESASRDFLAAMASGRDHRVLYHATVRALPAGASDPSRRRR